MKQVVIHAYGHVNIRGTHPKSLEITTAKTVSAKGTCIIGVAAELPTPALEALNGPVQLELECSGIKDSLEAQVNHGYTAIDTLIVRLSNFRCRKTFAVAATKAAADLDRALIANLRRAESKLTVTIRELPASAERPRTGLLVLAPMPIGNERDISLRVLDELKRADIIAAEDTRTTRKLLTRLDLKVKLLSFHDHNESQRLPLLLQLLADGQRVVVVSEAGTPSINDPGYPLVRAAVQAGVPIVALPGPCAAVVALTASGLATDRFVFLGFAPRTASRRRAFLVGVRRLPYTLIFYEAPHRIPAFLTDALAVLGDREVCLGRELTKPYEQLIRGRLSEALVQVEAAEVLRGEFTVVIAGATTPAGTSQPDTSPEDVDTMITSRLREGKPVRAIRDELRSYFGGSGRELYERILTVKATMEAQD